MSRMTDEIRADLQDVRSSAAEDQLAGPLALLAEKAHPVVAAERMRTRLGNRLALAACLAVPLLLMAAWWGQPLLEKALARPFNSALWPKLLALFVSLWPLVMILGAALRSASATLAERSEETALQLVLTPLRKRAIAAAKVLPHVWPFLWGVLAALPIYMLAGGMDHLLIDDHDPAPWAPWPWRFVATANILSYPRDPVEFSPAGVATGLLMALTDIGLVWAAAHWGAGLAVRVTSLTAVALRLLLRVILLGLALAGYLLLGLTAAILTFPVIHWLFAHDEWITVLVVVALFLPFWWMYPLRHAVRQCLGEFERFDRLAMDSEELSQDNARRSADKWWYDGVRP